MNLGTPLKSNATKVLLLGSGELGKELAIELTRLGIEVIACDRYPNAPAMQVAQKSHVFDMLNPLLIREIILKEKPHLIVPEIEAIATSELLKLEQEGWKIIPNAEAAYLTMNREGIRRLASEELDLPTAQYQFADSIEELKVVAQKLGFPCVIKPIMSSSGKGQSVAHSMADLENSWQYAQISGRAGAGRVIVEEFIDFESEITLLTLRTVQGTLFCHPIGHKQVEGDYIESWQPHSMSEIQIEKSKKVALAITNRLGGKGIFGVELFLLKNGEVYFSEVSPRPHDTGLVTLATQELSEFALHARAILGLPVQKIHQHSPGASVALKAKVEIENPNYIDVEKVFEEDGVSLRIFGKPTASVKRRMGVILTTGETSKIALEKARRAAEKIKIQ